MASDRMVGSLERRIDVRSKVFVTNSGHLVGVSGCAYNIDVEKLCEAIDTGKALKFMNSLDDRKVEFGIIVVTGSDAVAYHSEQDGKFSRTYLNSAGSCAYTGDLSWIVQSLYKGGLLPSLEDVISRIRHVHRAAGFADDAHVVVSNLDYTMGEDDKSPSVGESSSVGEAAELQSERSKVRFVFGGKLQAHKPRNPEHLDLLSELLDIMMDSADRLPLEGEY